MADDTAKDRAKQQTQLRGWFRAALVTAPELTATTARIGVIILEHFSFKTGVARPGTVLLAQEACARRETVATAINTLEARRWYHVVRGRGRGNVNRYTPCWESVRLPDTLRRLTHMGATPESVRLDEIKCPVCALENVVKPVQEPLNRTPPEPEEVSASALAEAEAETSYATMPKTELVAARERGNQREADSRSGTNGFQRIGAVLRGGG